MSGLEHIEVDQFPPKPLEFFYDEALDVMTIEGIKYSGNLFRELATGGVSNQAFKIVERTEEGKLTLQRVEEKI